MKSEEIKKIDAKNVEKNDKNNKGFTLIELLATISILAIIMLMAIPNVIGIVQRNKNKQYVEDAKKLVTLAKYEVRKTKNTTTYSLKDLDKSEEIKDGPNGSDYNRTGSGVVVTKSGSKYSYTVTLYEEKNGKSTGLFGITEQQLYSPNAVKLVSTTQKGSVPALPYSTSTPSSSSSLTDKVPTLTLTSKSCSSTCKVEKNRDYSGNIVLTTDGTYDMSKVGSYINNNLSSIVSIGGTYGGISKGNYDYYSAYVSISGNTIKVNYDIKSTNSRTGEVKIRVPAGAICGANNKCNKEQEFSTGVTVISGSTSNGTYY